jgi:hypothetical protein
MIYEKPGDRRPITINLFLFKDPIIYILFSFITVTFKGPSGRRGFFFPAF